LYLWRFRRRKVQHDVLRCFETRHWNRCRALTDQFIIFIIFHLILNRGGFNGFLKPFENIFLIRIKIRDGDSDIV
jgi:hypothetical protein